MLQFTVRWIGIDSIESPRLVLREQKSLQQHCYLRC